MQRLLVLLVLGLPFASLSPISIRQNVNDQEIQLNRRAVVDDQWTNAFVFEGAGKDAQSKKGPFKCPVGHVPKPPGCDAVISKETQEQGHAKSSDPVRQPIKPVNPGHPGKRGDWNDEDDLEEAFEKDTVPNGHAIPSGSGQRRTPVNPGHPGKRGNWNDEDDLEEAFEKEFQKTGHAEPSNPGGYLPKIPKGPGHPGKRDMPRQHGVAKPGPPHHKGGIDIEDYELDADNGFEGHGGGSQSHGGACVGPDCYLEEAFEKDSLPLPKGHAKSSGSGQRRTPVNPGHPGKRGNWNDEDDFEEVFEKEFQKTGNAQPSDSPHFVPKTPKDPGHPGKRDMPRQYGGYKPGPPHHNGGIDIEGYELAAGNGETGHVRGSQSPNSPCQGPDC